MIKKAKTQCPFCVGSNVKSTEILACGFEIHKMRIQYNNYCLVTYYNMSINDITSSLAIYASDSMQLYPSI